MQSPFTFNIKIPDELKAHIYLNTGLDFQDKLEVYIEYDKENPENGYKILFIDDKIVIRNPSISLTNGYVTHSSLDDIKHITERFNGKV